MRSGELQEGAARDEHRHRQGLRRQGSGRIIDYYEQRSTLAALSKEIGRDIDKFTDALNREVFSKIDPEKF